MKKSDLLYYEISKAFNRQFNWYRHCKLLHRGTTSLMLTLRHFQNQMQKTFCTGQYPASVRKRHEEAQLLSLLTCILQLPDEPGKKDGKTSFVLGLPPKKRVIRFTSAAIKQHRKHNDNEKIDVPSYTPLALPLPPSLVAYTVKPKKMVRAQWVFAEELPSAVSGNSLLESVVNFHLPNQTGSKIGNICYGGKYSKQHQYYDPRSHSDVENLAVFVVDLFDSPFTSQDMGKFHTLLESSAYEDLYDWSEDEEYNPAYFHNKETQLYTVVEWFNDIVNCEITPQIFELGFVRLYNAVDANKLTGEHHQLLLDQISLYQEVISIVNNEPDWQTVNMFTHWLEYLTDARISDIEAITNTLR